ncbi:unnamed protein product, partial [Sphenostylis stenocarpa]
VKGYSILELDLVALDFREQPLNCLMVYSHAPATNQLAPTLDKSTLVLFVFQNRIPGGEETFCYQAPNHATIRFQHSTVPADSLVAGQSNSTTLVVH